MRRTVIRSGSYGWRVDKMELKTEKSVNERSKGSLTSVTSSRPLSP